MQPLNIVGVAFFLILKGVTFSVLEVGLTFYKPQLSIFSYGYFKSQHAW